MSFLVSWIDSDLVAWSFVGFQCFVLVMSCGFLLPVAAFDLSMATGNDSCLTMILIVFRCSLVCCGNRMTTLIVLVLWKNCLWIQTEIASFLEISILTVTASLLEVFVHVCQIASFPEIFGCVLTIASFLEMSVFCLYRGSHSCAWCLGLFFVPVLRAMVFWSGVRMGSP